MMEEHCLTQDEFHSKLYGVSLIATLVAAHWKNELIPGIDYFLFRPGTVTEIETLGEVINPTWTIARKAAVLMLFGTTGIMGASCLGAITKRFGALSMALTSTARKATTLFLSFALFNNECTPEHVAGVSLFMTGLVMKTLNKRNSSQQQQTAGDKLIEGPRSSSYLGKFSCDLRKLPYFLSWFCCIDFSREREELLRHRNLNDIEV
jgi:UAA transporter family